MSTLSIILLWLSLLHLEAGPFLIIQEKRITVNGNTSIGSFSCDYGISGKNDRLYMDRLTSSPYSFSVPVEAFRCGNFLLNRDFRTTLKAKRYPEISVQVLKLQKEKNGIFRGTIKLHLVGKSKILKDVKFTLKAHDKNQVLSTDFIFSASEFELIPPKKLGGLIKTEDNMEIIVSLVLKSAIE
ncbi:MAG: hypothetical protein WD426_20090 [Anditalea sp.]